jgi:hypothetical protein
MFVSPDKLSDEKRGHLTPYPCRRRISSQSPRTSASRNDFVCYEVLRPMPKKKKPSRMTSFTKKDIKYLVDDLRLYSGNIARVTDLHGPHPHDGHISGVLHTLDGQV